VELCLAALAVGIAALALLAWSGLFGPLRSRGALVHAGLPVYDLRFPAGRSPAASADGFTRASFRHDGLDYEVEARRVEERGATPTRPAFEVRFLSAAFEHAGQLERADAALGGRREIRLVAPELPRLVLERLVAEILGEHGVALPFEQLVVLRVDGELLGLYLERERPPQSDPVGHRARLALAEPALAPPREHLGAVRAVLDWEPWLLARALASALGAAPARPEGEVVELVFDETRGLLLPRPGRLRVERRPAGADTLDLWVGREAEPLEEAVLHQPELRLERNRLLWKLMGDGTLVKRLARLQEAIRTLAWGDPHTSPAHLRELELQRDDLVHNLRRARALLRNAAARFEYRLESPERARLELAAEGFSGVRLDAVRVRAPGLLAGSYRLFEDVDGDGRLGPADPMRLETRAAGGALELVLSRPLLPRLEPTTDVIEGRRGAALRPREERARFFLTGTLGPERRRGFGWQAPELAVEAANVVTGERLAQAVVPPGTPARPGTVSVAAWDDSTPFDLAAADRGLAEFLAAHREFRADPRPGAARLEGRVRLSETVIVPRGVPLVLAPGLDLSLGPGVSLLAYGGLEALGTSEAPIRVRGDGSGAPFGVLAVLRPAEPVRIRHLELEGGSEARVNGVRFTGGLAVQEGALEIEQCRIREMRGRDALSLRRGRLAMRQCRIEGFPGDGLDLDHASAEIHDSVFAGGGDGIDLTASRAVVVASRFEDMAEEGFQAGEGSRPILVDDVFRGNVVGLSLRDLSFARVANCHFVDNEVAVEALREKPAFGGAGGEFLDSVFRGNRRLLREDHFSRGRVRLLPSPGDGPSASCSGCAPGSTRVAAAPEAHE
jgi:hypothetical protein